MWRIDDTDLEQFVRRYPWQYDRARIEWGSYWRNLANRVWVADPYLTVPEAAAVLGVCSETVSRWCRAGRLAAVRTTYQGAGKYGRWLLAQSIVTAFAVPRTGSTGRRWAALRGLAA